MGSPEPPAVVFLYRFTKDELMRCERGQPVTQPGSKIFAETIRIDEMRFHFPVLEQISLNCQFIAHLVAPHGKVRLRRGSSLYPCGSFALLKNLTQIVPIVGDGAAFGQ